MIDNVIKILPENIASKIAAGEVVQRPESVVKELLENSIDAGANEVELIIKKAGKQLIQVCDNGSGMSESDAELCIQKHATSKISSYDDLEAIRTLGFRGEALSSIAAVSQIEIRTERAGDELGTLIRNDESGRFTKEKGSFPKGTCVIVKNLFYNVPARRNFLKTDATELKHIIDSFNKIALSYWDISFSLFNDDNLIYDYKAGKMEDRIRQVFADNMLDALLPVEEKTDYISLTGFIGKPTMLRKSKGEQYLFLNNRYINSKQINHAVFSAYENFLEKGDYPFFVLYLEIDPKKTDVNIHPSKLEARFDDEKDVYNFVLAVIKKTLGTHDLVPSVNFSETLSAEEKLRIDSFSRVKRNDFSDRPSGGSLARTKLDDSDIDLLFNSITEQVQTQPASQMAEHPLEKTEIKQSERESEPERKTDSGTGSPFIIQLHNKYILSQIKSGLMIIDQHVAHERILYEKALKRMESGIPFSQQLLFAKTVQLDPGRYNLLKEIYDDLQKLGFGIKFFSKNTIVIEGVPDDIKKGAEEKVLLDILEEYSAYSSKKESDERDKIAKSYSCRTAIKAGDTLSENEMRVLIDQLFATSMPYVCPHGRPVVIKISLDEFDRRFGRT
ncbi:MAG: DNA mismatch repair endonuclease MutL [Ignavibacteriaceae bacterium]